MEEEVLKETQPEIQPETEPEKPSKGNKFTAALKEWCRKRIVALKVRPQTIPLLVMVITTVYFMLVLFSLSKAVMLAAGDPHTAATGICIFITTLLSLLYIVSFLNSFPKRKKPNIFFIVLVGVMIAGQLACDLVYYLQMDACIKNITNLSSDMYVACTAAQPYMIGHIVLLALSAVVFALLPVYTKLIRKIDTSIKLESATEHMHGNIDIEEDD